MSKDMQHVFTALHKPLYFSQSHLSLCVCVVVVTVCVCVVFTTAESSTLSLVGFSVCAHCSIREVMGSALSKVWDEDKCIIAAKSTQHKG